LVNAHYLDIQGPTFAGLLQVIPRGPFVLWDPYSACCLTECGSPVNGPEESFFEVMEWICSTYFTVSILRIYHGIALVIQSTVVSQNTIALYLGMLPRMLCEDMSRLYIAKEECLIADDILTQAIWHLRCDT